MRGMTEAKGERGPRAGRHARSTGRWLLAVALLGVMACKTTEGQFTWVEDYRDPRQGSPYVIAIGDSVHVRVFNQEGMSGTARVRPDGKISLPFVNDIVAAGETPVALAKQVQARLKDVLVNPVVTVSVEEVRPLEVSVLGEVRRPGIYRLERGSGVLTALAAAGGIGDFGNKDAIFVIRDGSTRIRFTWHSLQVANEAAAGFQVRPGDVIIVE